MVNLISDDDDLVSSLQAPDGDGLKAEDVAKRLLELQSRSRWLEEEREKLRAHNLVIEQRCRDQLRSLEEKEEEIIRLKEEAASVSGTGGRWKRKYETAQVEFEKGERKWRADLGKAEEKNRDLELEMKKLAIDLQSVRRAAEGGGGENGDKFRAEVEQQKRLVDDKDGLIGLLNQKYEALEKEKMKIEKELWERLTKLEGAVAEWLGLEVNSDGKTVDNTKSLIEPKKEIVEEAINAEHDRKLNSKVVAVQKLTNSPVVELSDDEEEDESSGDTTPKAIANAPPVASPLAAKGQDNLAVPQKRKAEDVAYSTERQSESKRSKFEDSKVGQTWESAGKMFLAFNTNIKLCMSSVCALYRKHKSLGVWKNQSDGKIVLRLVNEKSFVELGEFLTGGDPEGRMKKSVADMEGYRSRIELCRNISRSHFKELFEICSRNLDPLFP